MNSNFYINKSIFKQYTNQNPFNLNKNFRIINNLITLKNYLLFINYYSKEQTNFKLNILKGKLIKIKKFRLILSTKHNIIIKLPLNLPLIKIIKFSKN